MEPYNTAQYKALTIQKRIIQCSKPTKYARLGSRPDIQKRIVQIRRIQKRCIQTRHQLNASYKIAAYKLGAYKQIEAYKIFA